MSSPRPRALLVDLGNVVIPDPRPVVVRALAARDGLARRALTTAYYAEVRRMAAGRSTLGECYRELRRRFSLTTTYSEFRDLVGRRALRSYPSVVSALRALKARPTPRVVFASNIEAPVWHGLCRRFALHRLADATVLSFRIGRLKPDPAFYRAALRVARVEAAEALYLDDLPENVRAAVVLGIPSHRVRSPADAASLLRRHAAP